jgi:hypothetical protein
MLSKYWVNSVYGMGYWLRYYAYYPKSFPLYSYMDHGMTLFDTIPAHELENDAYLMFKFSPRLVDAYKKVSKKPVYCLMNPTIHYRIKNDIQQAVNADKTLFFVAHSTPDLDDHTNWQKFIDNLERIPEQFKPIDICLHHHDIVKGLDRIFIDRGFKVVSAGNPYAINYIELFYSVLSNYKYTMSNLIGSYTFYSVEMGIPFSFYGDEPVYFNKGDNNIESGSYTSYKVQPTYQKALNLFNGYYTQITQSQSDFVNIELGKNNTIGRLRACLLLYKALFQNLFTHPGTIKPVLLSLLKSIKQNWW